MARSGSRSILVALNGALLLATLAATSIAAQTQAPPFSWTGTLAAGTTFEVKGVNGSIRAEPATGSAASVEATRTGRRDDPAEVEIVVLQHAGGVTLCAVYPGTARRPNECRPGDEGRISSFDNDVRVDFVIAVPAGVAFVARTVNGEIDAAGLTSDVEVSSTNGDVRVDGGSYVAARTTNGSVWIRTSGLATASATNGSIEADLRSLPVGSETLSFRTTNGSVTLRVPADLRATVDARTSNGGIHSALPILVQGSFGRDRLQGTIGGGGRLIDIRTTNGRIRLEQGI